MERREQKTPRLQGTSTGREERLGDERLAHPVNRLSQAEVKKIQTIYHWPTIMIMLKRSIE